LQPSTKKRKYVAPSHLTWEERRRIENAVNRVKQRSKEESSMTFIIVAFEGNRMYFSESPKMIQVLHAETLSIAYPEGEKNDKTGL